MDEEISRALERVDLPWLERLGPDLWSSVPSRHTTHLLSLISRLPPDTLHAHPQLLLAGYLAYRLDRVHGAGDGSADRYQNFYQTWGPLYESSYTRFVAPTDVAAAGMIALVGARQRGDFARSELIARRIDETLTRRRSPGALPWDPDPAAQRPGWLAPQRALTNLLLGRFDDAMLHARVGYEQEVPPSMLHARCTSAAYAALIFALSGSRRYATEWLRRFDDLFLPEQGAGPLLTRPAQCARAFLALDDLDESTAEAVLTDLGDAAEPHEVWPFVAAAWARFDLLFRDATLGLIRLDDTLTAHGIGPAADGVGGGILLRARADLLLAAGEPQAALALANAHSDRTSMRVVAAHALLQGGQSARAIRAASNQTRRDASNRDKVDFHLLLATAQLRRGNDSDATTLFGKALTYVEQSGILAAMTMVPAEELKRLCELAERLDLYQQVADRARLYDYADLPLLDLTRRERVIAQALATDDTLRDIARTLSVSVNTVRSQVRSLYRKLGVSERHEAVAVAARYGLIDEEPRSPLESV